MSSAEGKSAQRSRRPSPGRAFARARLTLALSSAVLAGGCGDGFSGFHPLYGSAALGGVSTQEKFRQVEFAPIPGRVGQRLRNELIFESTGGGEAVPPEYRLDVAINESVVSTLVQIDGNAQGQVYNLDVAFKLIRLKDKSVVLEGRSYGRAGFERVTSIYANVSARQDAENRAAKTVGEEMRTRLLAYFSRPA
jgi:LPS-assembly lipoprotein